MNKMVNAWMTHLKPFIADEKKEAKKEGRKFKLLHAIREAKKTYKKKHHGGDEGGAAEGGRRRRRTHRKRRHHKD
jgi:hypothetical protein